MGDFRYLDMLDERLQFVNKMRSRDTAEGVDIGYVVAVLGRRENLDETIEYFTKLRETIK